MGVRPPLGEFEQVVLLAVLRLEGAAYAVPVRREIEKRTRRSVTRGALYVTLERLEDKGYLESWLADPTPERGGRSKRHYRLEKSGERALHESVVAAKRICDVVDHAWGKSKPWKPARQS